MAKAIIKTEQYRVRPGHPIKLSDVDAGEAKSLSGARDDIEAQLTADTQQLAEFQERLYAEGRQALLVVFLATDTGGKDSTIGRVFGPLNPQGIHVTGFGVPTEEEQAHDFLWRVHPHVPPKGAIGIFNRSHYEDLVVPRVYDSIDRPTWERRYAHVRNFEELLLDCATSVVKFHLRISKDEQAERLRDRIEDPSKHWKFNPNDLEDRKRWDSYQAAYEDAINATSTDAAPWYVVPANSKWYRDAIVARVLVETVERLDPHYPPPVEGIEKYRIV